MKKFKVLKFVFVVLIFSILFSACGGGTSGTGGNNRVTRIEGTLLQKVSSAPLPGVTVRLEQTGAQSVTNSTGDFVIVVSVDLDQADFIFNGGGVNDRTNVSNIPNSARVIDLEFEADIDSGKVDLEETDFDESLFGGEYCDIFPDDPTCEEELEDFCFNFPNDPFCEELFFDEYCFDYPEDPLCYGEGDFFDDSELDYCEEFPEDEICFEDDFLDDCEFGDEIFCDDEFLDDYCFEFPEDELCFEDDFTDDCEFEDETLCDDEFFDEYCEEFPDYPGCIF